MFFLFVILLSSFSLLPASSRAYTSPGKPTGFVNDFAGVLSASDKQSIESELVSLRQSTSAQVVVATVPSLGDETIESYAVDLFQEWGIGEKGKDNGLLILVAPNDREARIEVGYGLEGDVTDLQAGNIIRDVMIPAFKKNDYAAGIKGSVDAVSGLVEKSPDAVQYDEQDSGDDSSPNLTIIFFVGFILLNALARILGKTKSWWLGGVIGAIVGVIAGFAWGFVPFGIVAIILLTIFGLIFDYLVSKHPPGNGRGPGGFWPIFFLGGGRGGSGGGGFGGFGGGGSGGGGASGGW